MRDAGLGVGLVARRRRRSSSRSRRSATWSSRSEITRSPESSSVSTQFCTAGSYAAATHAARTVRGSARGVLWINWRTIGAEPSHLRHASAATLAHVPFHSPGRAGARDGAVADRAVRVARRKRSSRIAESSAADSGRTATTRCAKQRRTAAAGRHTAPQSPDSLRAGAFAVAARAAAAAAAAATAAVAARPVLARLARRGVLRPLDELLRRDELAVLVLLDQLQADPSARLVDLLHEHVDARRRARARPRCG